MGPAVLVAVQGRAEPGVGLAAGRGAVADRLEHLAADQGEPEVSVADLDQPAAVAEGDFAGRGSEPAGERVRGGIRAEANDEGEVV